MMGKDGRNSMGGIRRKMEEIFSKIHEFFLISIFLSFIPFSSLYTQGKFSGYMFGDYYYILSHNDTILEGQNGFWFRRIYFTYDYKISDEFSTRFRLELNSPGDFKTKEVLKPYLKDAYLGWKKGTQNLILGISPTPTWEYIENFWGYRSVEKTPLDLYKMGDSRDFGVALKGSLSREELISYHLMFANGEGLKGEVNKEKKYMGSFLLKPLKYLSLEIYGDYEKTRWTYQGFLGYKFEKGRMGTQYTHQRKQETDEKNWKKFDVFSIFGVLNISEKISFLLRYDRMEHSLPGASTIRYVPMNETSPFHLGLLGLDFKIAPDVSFIPNIMAVYYDELKKNNRDIYLKLTFFYSFK